MKRLNCLIVICLLSACKPSHSQDTPARPANQAGPAKPAAAPGTAPGDPQLSGPYVHDNLTIFLIHKPGAKNDPTNYLILEEAVQAKTLHVTEKADGAQVNKIEIENVGDQPVFLQAGDTVKGGKQDRVIAVDYVLPARSGKKQIDAFCVEPGRWSGRVEGGARYANVFGAASAPVASKEQKLAVKLSRDQGKVWEEGRKTNEGLASKSASTARARDSYVLTIEDPAIQKKVAEYTDALQRIPEGKDDVIGMAFAVNGDPSTVEIYSGPALFRKLWTKLLKGASLEALSKKTSQPPTKQAGEADIRTLLTQAADGKTSTRVVSEEVKLETIDGTRSAQFDTRVKDDVLHRQVVTK